MIEIFALLILLGLLVGLGYLAQSLGEGKERPPCPQQKDTTIKVEENKDDPIILNNAGVQEQNQRGGFPFQRRERLQNQAALNNNINHPNQQQNDQVQQDAQEVENRRRLEEIDKLLAEPNLDRKDVQRLERRRDREIERQRLEQLNQEATRAKEQKDLKQRQAEQAREARDRQIEEREALEERRKQLEEQALFDAWKKQMQVGECGNEQKSEDLDKRNARLVEYVKRRKVVCLGKVAAEFGLTSSKEVATLLKDLEQNKIQESSKECEIEEGNGEEIGQIQGIVDDRGKYIYISREEFKQIGQTMSKQGRIDRGQLLKIANQIVSMGPTESELACLEKEESQLVEKVTKKFTDQNDSQTR